ncbi:MAG: amino acid permease [Thermoflexibacter sp.]
MSNKAKPSVTLSRQLGLLGLTATGICSMLGASIYVVPVMIQRNVIGIGTWVLPAFIFAAIPALLAALAYASLSATIPMTGGSYIFASRGLSPYLGFIASFSQWFGLSIVIGVICYIIIPFFRDIAYVLGWQEVALYLGIGWLRVGLALGILWFFIWINRKGLRFYERTVIPLMLLMFGLGAIVIVVGFNFNHEDFACMLLAKQEKNLINPINPIFSLGTFFSASAVLFASFIGFDSIAQAGGEAKNPEKLLPRAIILAFLVVSSFYFVFTAAVYHAIPWQFIAQEAADKDISVAGLFSLLLSPTWGAVILIGATVALLNDLPAMLLAVSRLLFAWAEDGIFPKKLAYINPHTQIPDHSLLVSGLVATVGVLGSHWAGDFFLGVDIMVTSMLVNFLLMCFTWYILPKRNFIIAKKMNRLIPEVWRNILAIAGIVFLSIFLIIHVWKDTSAIVHHWYFHSTYAWLIVMSIASCIYFWRKTYLKANE